MEYLAKCRLAHTNKTHLVSHKNKYQPNEFYTMSRSLEDYYYCENLKQTISKNASSQLVGDVSIITDMEKVKAVFKHNYARRDYHFELVLELLDVVGNDPNTTIHALRKQEILYNERVTTEQVEANVLEHINAGTNKNLFLSYNDRTTYDLNDDDMNDLEPKQELLEQFGKWSRNETCGTFWMVPIVPGASKLCESNTYRFTSDIDGLKPTCLVQTASVEDMLASNAGAFSSPHVDQCSLTAQSIMLDGLKLFILFGSSKESYDEYVKCNNSSDPLKYLIQNYHRFGTSRSWIVMGPRQSIVIDANCVHAVLSLTRSSLYGCMYVEYSKYADLAENITRYIDAAKSMVDYSRDNVVCEISNSLALWELSYARMQVAGLTSLALEVKKAIKVARQQVANLL